MAQTLINQPTGRTNRKVTSASWNAAWIAPASLVLSALLAEFLPGDLRPYVTEMALLVSAVLTGVGTWVAGYYTRERA